MSGIRRRLEEERRAEEQRLGEEEAKRARESDFAKRDAEAGVELVREFLANVQRSNMAPDQVFSNSVGPTGYSQPWWEKGKGLALSCYILGSPPRRSPNFHAPGPRLPGELNGEDVYVLSLEGRRLIPTRTLTTVKEWRFSTRPLQKSPKYFWRLESSPAYATDKVQLSAGQYDWSDEWMSLEDAMVRWLVSRSGN